MVLCARPSRPPLTGTVRRHCSGAVIGYSGELAPDNSRSSGELRRPVTVTALSTVREIRAQRERQSDYITHQGSQPRGDWGRIIWNGGTEKVLCYFNWWQAK